MRKLILSAITALLCLSTSSAEAKFVSITGTDLNYYDNGGTGPVVVLVHGNTSGASAFQHQLISADLAGYRVIALDLPGSGASNDACGGNARQWVSGESYEFGEQVHHNSSTYECKGWPNGLWCSQVGFEPGVGAGHQAWTEAAFHCDPAAVYTLPGLADTLVRFVEALGIEDATIIGWSWGGHAVLEASGQLPNAKGFGIFGTPPIKKDGSNFGDAYFPHPDSALGFQEVLTPAEQEAYTDIFFAADFTDPRPTFLMDAQRTDGAFRLGVLATVSTGDFIDPFSLVGALTQPLLIIHGMKDQLIQGTFFATVPMPTLWDATIAGGAVQFIAGAGHAPHFETPDEFSGILKAFLDDINS